MPYCPDQNVSPEYPPTLLLHGDQDTDVPYELSVRMAAALAAHKVPHELVTMHGQGHGFAKGQDTFDRVFAFLKRAGHLRVRRRLTGLATRSGPWAATAAGPRRKLSCTSTMKPMLTYVFTRHKTTPDA